MKYLDAQQSRPILNDPAALRRPPAILFFRANSDAQDELKNARLIGFYPPERFLVHLEKFGF